MRFKLIAPVADLLRQGVALMESLSKSETRLGALRSPPPKE
jgi:hypothetical protein